MSADFENHVIDLLPAYTLDVLTDEETSLVAEHLTGCEICHAEYQRLLLVANELPLALVQTAPPPRVKENLMRAIHARQPKETTSTKPNFWNNLSEIFRMRLPAWGLALILVLALGNLLLWRQYNPSNSQTNTPMLLIALASTTDAPMASGTLIMDQNGDYGTLVVDQLPTLDAQHQYQVWLNRGGERVSGGLFSVNNEGYGSMELLAPDSLTQYDSIGITIEPKGGSLGPTGAKVLGGDLPN
jgi:anti-sigma-K factor RskA